MANYTSGWIKPEAFSSVFRHFSTCYGRSPHLLWHPPIDPLDQQRELGRAQHDPATPIIQLGPDETALVQPFGEQAQPVAIPE
jgi:hypothetical protein